jgi:hypothetical protein
MSLTIAYRPQNRIGIQSRILHVSGDLITCAIVDKGAGVERLGCECVGLTEQHTLAITVGCMILWLD